jgi:hypothetical protein
MKRLIRSLFLAATLFGSQLSLQAQTTPTKAWDKTLGGSSLEELNSIQQTSDGGYIMGGLSQSGISGDKTHANKGYEDYWVVKLDASGNKLWDKTYGANFPDFLTALQQTSDGGYILGGYSFSGINGDKTQASRGAYDYWVLKIDANGNKLWDKTFGGPASDQLYTLQQTADGGYILGGTSSSGNYGDKTETSRGLSDFWIIKLDAIGNKQWDKTFGGSNYEELFSLKQTADGGYILGGSSKSTNNGDKSQGTNGLLDYWVVRVNASGNKLWDKTFGGGGNEEIHSLVQTSDGGYLVGGYSNSGMNWDKSQASKGLSDYWVLKLDTNGNKTWDKTIGGSDGDNLRYLQEATGGGYILGGYSLSPISGDKTESPLGYWVVKVDASGNKLWDKSIGPAGGGAADLRSMQQTLDRGYIIGGVCASGIGGDKTQPSQGLSDFWVVKLNPTCSDLSGALTASCNGSTITLNLTGIQSTSTGSPSWTLNYTVNGVSQTASGTTPTFILGQNITSNATYSLINITSGTCTTNLTNTITVQPIPAPTVVSGSNCGPGSVVLSAVGALSGSNYIWYDVSTGGTPLQTSPTGTFTTPNLSTTTTYYVAATNSSGCESPRIPVTATITNLTANAGTNETICFNAAPVQLTGFSPAGGTWSGAGVSATGFFSPTSSLVGNQTLTYTVTQNGCSATSTKQVTVPAAIAQPTISLIATDTLISSVTGSSYVWKHNNATLPNTTRKLKAIASGTYAVQVKDASNCTSAFSADYSFVISGTKEELAAGIALYPNPTSGIINLALEGQQPAQVTILNALGQEVLIKTVGTNNSKATHPLDLGGLAKGIYLVQVRTKKQVVVRKVVVE